MVNCRKMVTEITDCRRGFIIVEGMSTRHRRIHDKRRATARRREGQCDDVVLIDGQHARLVRFAYAMSCMSCGYSDADEMNGPSSAPIGAQVDITTSCTCGGQTDGMARVLEIVEEVLT